MYTFLTIYSIVVLVLLVFKIKWGLILYILMIFLLPSLSFTIGGIALKWNFFNLLLLFSLLFYVKRYHLNISISECKPFFWYFGVLFLFIPIEYELSYSYQLITWFGNVLRYFIVPLAMFSLFKENNVREVIFLNYIVYVCIFVATIYGLFLTQTEGINPYLLLMISDADNLIEYAAPSEDRLFGRISSVFSHPMTFGCFLVVAFFFCLYKIILKKDGCVPIVLLILIISCAMTCGVRSVLAGIMLGLMAFLLFNHKIKYLFYTIVVAGLILFIVFQEDVLYTYVASIFSSSASADVKGSSVEMRLRQLLGCFDIISSNPLFGNGFGWTAYYNQMNGDHPVVFVVGAQDGIAAVSGKTWLFLILSGFATGASWLCYFHALQTGDVNKVVPIDKSSTILTIVLAFLFLGEEVSALKIVCVILIGAGTFLMIQKKETEKSAGQEKRSWLLYACLSAVFASLTSILGKIGIEGLNSNLGTAIRTAVVLLMAWIMVFAKGKQKEIGRIDRRELGFICLSGLATGGSWLCYYKALQDGLASVVVPIDKLSILVTIAFSYLVFHEKLTKRAAIGLVLIVAGTLLMIL